MQNDFELCYVHAESVKIEKWSILNKNDYVETVGKHYHQIDKNLNQLKKNVRKTIDKQKVKIEHVKWSISLQQWVLYDDGTDCKTLLNSSTTKNFMSKQK